MKQNFPLIRFPLYHATPRIYKLLIIHVNILDDDQEEAEMKRHIKIVKDDEVAIDAIPLATKPPMIVEYKIDKDGRMRYYKLIRADGSSKSAAGASFTNDDPSSPANVVEASNAFKEHLFERFSPFKNTFTLPPVLNVTPMDDTVIFSNAYDDEDVGAEADLNNLEITMNGMSPTILPSLNTKVASKQDELPSSVGLDFQAR
ncbi:hypothetical protein Tco_0673877 [Tanacetum coccineum]